MNRPRLKIRNMVFGDRMLLADRILSEKIADIPCDIDNSLKNSPDAFEWRADYLAEYAPLDIDAICTAAGIFAGKAPDTPVIFTCRHPEEKGMKDITDSDKFDLIDAVLKTRTMDLIDIEKRYGAERLSEYGEKIRSAGSKLIISHHDFDTEHTAAENFASLLEMQSYGADVVKLIAKVKNNHELLEFVRLVKEAWNDGTLKVPVIAGQTCDVSAVMRVFGDALCNDLTFVDSYEKDFPRHININDMRRLRELVFSIEKEADRP